MGNIRLKTLDMNNEIDKKILLSYFFKKPNTVWNKKELLTLSCIYYDSSKNNLLSCTNRFVNELIPFQNKIVLNKEVDNTLKTILSDSLKIQEELVRCDLQTDNGIDHFYIAVIGVDFFLTETELRKEVL